MATKLGIIGVNEVRAHTHLRARADIVATKLGIFLFLPSMYFSTRRGLPRKLNFGR